LGTGLLLGGAVGNLWDRVWLGAVTDFISVTWTRDGGISFNVADVALVAGAVVATLALYRALFAASRSPAAAPTASGASLAS
jgi:signal peptidase II